MFEDAPVNTGAAAVALLVTAETANRSPDLTPIAKAAARSPLVALLTAMACLTPKVSDHSASKAQTCLPPRGLPAR